jgi:hypothetical protein
VTLTLNRSLLNLRRAEVDHSATYLRAETPFGQGASGGLISIALPALNTGRSTPTCRTGSALRTCKGDHHSDHGGYVGDRAIALEFDVCKTVDTR